MEDLFTHIVHPFLEHPEELEFNIIEGKASVLIEVKLNPSDQESFDKDKTQSLLQVLSLASGNKKPSIEFVSSFDEQEDSSSDSSSDSESEAQEAQEAQEEAQVEETKDAEQSDSSSDSTSEAKSEDPEE